MQEIEGSLASEITLELNADSIKFTTILGVGTIDLASINNF
jgi:hypothetical protein